MRELGFTEADWKLFRKRLPIWQERYMEKLIEEYNKKLEDQIYKLLSEPHNNYNLQIALSRYENQVELLRKRMEIKKNENIFLLLFFKKCE